MLLARRTGTGLVCHASTATPVHSRGECCLRDGLVQDLFVTQARPHRFIHVVNVACETDWHRTCLSRNTPVQSRGECCLRDGLAQDLFVTQAHGHTGSLTWWMLLARRTGTGLVCHASTATPGHSRGECCLRDGLAQDLFVTQARPHRFICLRDGLPQDLFVTQARPHRFIHVVNIACETDWHRTCLSRKHGHTGSFTW